MKALFGIILSFFGFGTPGITHDASLPSQAEERVSTAACYSLEPNTIFTVDTDTVAEDCSSGDFQVSGKSYVRLRKGVKITSAKIGEGKANWKTCRTTEPSGYGALRKISNNTNDPAQPGDVFWEDLNYQGDDLKDFILILTEKTDTEYVFDVYVEQSKSENLPEFVINCKETGGLVPVLEGTATNTFPPQTISVTKHAYNTQANQVFSTSCCSEEFKKQQGNGYLFDYYLRISKQAKPAPAGKIGQLTKTINNETRTYDVFFHAGTVYMVDTSSSSPEKGVSWLYNGSNTEPPLGTGWKNPSLQLNKLDFITTSEWTWATPECKPAIYLYPPEKMDVHVKVVPDGKLTTSIPDHGNSGWDVTAWPDGTIDSNGKSYPYLYYETFLQGAHLPEDGWVIDSDRLLPFFKNTLPQLGLNEKEQKDFMEYWIPKLQSGQKWLIKLLDRKELDRVEPIEFSQNPDMFIRVRFYFENLDGKNPSEFSLHTQYEIPDTTYEREGFTAVDWGGIIKGGTCSEGYISQ